MVAACGQQDAPPANSSATPEMPSSNAQAAAPVKASAPAARPFSVEEENDLYGFSYSWPAEAAAVPELVAQFTSERDKAKGELAASAKLDREERRKQGFDFHPYAAQVTYETRGQSDRLLSLERNVYSFTGGAHGSSGSGAVLWDRNAAHQVSIPDLVQPGQSWTGAVRQPFCVLLDREREKRRGEPVRKDDMFGECPKYEELTALISDDDRNGRFDHVKVIADQYVAGPYVEGPYEISLPITPTMIERLKPEYRRSFEPKPPVS
jgi:hypothetical protein